MPNILISDCDNPTYAYGTIIISVLCNDKEFESNGYKGKYGIDQNGNQTEYTNSSNIKHYLIKDCTAEEFVKSMTNSSRIKTPINFRIVNDELVEKKPLHYGEWPKNKINLQKVFESPCFSSDKYRECLNQLPTRVIPLNHKKV